MPTRMIHEATCQPTEEAEQRIIFEWAHYAGAERPELQLLFAIPNGGYRTKVTAGRMKATGTKPGVPDMFLPVPRSGYHGLWIELKRRGGGRISPGQRIWAERLVAQGYAHVFAHGADEAIEAIESYLKADSH